MTHPLHGIVAGQSIEEPGIAQQKRKRATNLLAEGATAVDNRQGVFEVMASKVVLAATPTEGFQFGREKYWG
jgi:hypothetical protein